MQVFEIGHKSTMYGFSKNTGEFTVNCEQCLHIIKGFLRKFSKINPTD